MNGSTWIVIGALVVVGAFVWFGSKGREQVFNGTGTGGPDGAGGIGFGGFFADENVKFNFGFQEV